jgi:thioredoxin reductase (NADPH)
VTLHIGSEIAALEGDCQSGLTGVAFRNRNDSSISHCALKHLFLFIGADPNTSWLGDCVETDGKGFVCTGLSEALPLETSRAGVFAIGDVRAGSVKRVAAGVGEGAAVVAQIHQALAAQQESIRHAEAVG